MTREEAIKKLYECSNEPVGLGEDWAAFEVDKYVALGILKLDEPKSPNDRLCEALGWPAGGHSASELSIALNEANLKLVEK